MQKCYRCLGLYLLIFSRNIIVESKSKSPQTHKDSLVEIRAVFINCETDGRHDNVDSPSARFERQELFKHNALRGCNKKLALTVKIASPDPAVSEETVTKSDTSGDEYIPIDHVFEGSDRKRVRLLNPYILRLRRESPKQAYKLRRIDTVSGVFKATELSTFFDNFAAKRQVHRERRELDTSELLGSPVFTLEHENPHRSSYSVRIGRLQELIKAIPLKSSPENIETTQDCGLRLFSTSYGKYLSTKAPLNNSDNIKDKRETCLKTNGSFRKRDKREIENQIRSVIDDLSQNYLSSRIEIPRQSKHHNQRLHERGKQDKVLLGQRLTEDNKIRSTREYGPRKLETPKHTPKPTHTGRHSESHDARSLPTHKESDTKDPEIVIQEKKVPKSEKQFAVYEIGNPDLWYDIKVHLFEKLSTPEGKTVWNDLTKGEDASVSSADPEWKGQEVNVRYRPAEWVPRDDFTLPTTKLCLLEPLLDNLTESEDDYQESSNAVGKNYIVVPVEDLVYLTEENKLKNREVNITKDAANENEDANIQVQIPRPVEVRMSRAIYGSEADNFDIARVGAGQFLTLPHRRPHHSQIDVEVRADDNMLVRVGAVIRECGPELTSLIKNQGSEEISSEPILLPPYHTRRMKLEVPVEIPTDVSHCNVALINDEDESVAVRDITIRKGDRCFCVWHCECVCLSEDPKLLCREMSPPQQAAAGLAADQRSRYTRSICYKDIISLDFISVVLSVLIFLLALGFFKAFVGLWDVTTGQLGWNRILECPRRIPCYFEPCLRERDVVYKDGWPVHPDTQLPTVRVLSCPASFLLNLVFFVLLPTLTLYSATLAGLRYLKKCVHKTRCKIRKVDKQIFSAQDLQSESMELVVRKKHKRRKLTDWMTPCAEQLTADIIQGAVEPALNECNQENEMQPLLHETKLAWSEGAASVVQDSEQEDTDYVLMQMQKSRESLARSQKKLNNSVHSNPSQAKMDTVVTTSKN